MGAEKKRPGDERGATIVFVALTMVALMSAVALAVDVGMLLNSRSEAQRAADSAALAGAGRLLANPGQDALARQEAIQYGGLNTIRDESVEVLPEDVEVDLATNRVRVTVRRIADRGNAVATWFARVFGVDEVDIAAVAAAEVGQAAGATCLKPWTVPDAWGDADGDEVYDPGEFYDAPTTGYGTDYRNGMPNGVFPLLDNQIDPIGTTYVNDRGRPIRLKSGNPQQSIVSGWFFPWDIPQVDGGPDTGGDRYRWNIANCNPTLISLGDEYMVENGNMIGPTKQGIRDLIDKDPNAAWDLTADSLVNSDFSPWEASPRIVHVPLYDPTSPIDPGKKPIVFTNIVSFYVLDMQGNDVIGRFMDYANGIGGGGVVNVPGLQYVHLVE